MKPLPAILLFAAFAALPALADDVTAVRGIDLDRYAGTWREIASIPQFFQRKCASGTTAVYENLPNGMVSVDNSCATKAGERIAAQGRARVTDPKSPARLEVTFLRFLGEWRFWFGADYWVIGLDPGYRWAVVGHPARTYAWVLSRGPRLSPPDLAAVLEVLRAQGYDACDLLITPQEGGWQERQPLCRHGAG
jgi:apolipoprotein D and lipocalin family protein